MLPRGPVAESSGFPAPHLHRKESSENESLSRALPGHLVLCHAVAILKLLTLPSVPRLGAALKQDSRPARVNLSGLRGLGEPSSLQVSHEGGCSEAGRCGAGNEGITG